MSLNIDLDEMQNPATVTVLNNRNLIQINSKRSFNGIKVRNSFITAVINNGNLVLTGTRNWGDISLSISPAITQTQARLTVDQFLGVDTANANWGKSEMFFVPVANVSEQFKLVHAFNLTFNDDPMANWEALVDANSNELIAFEDKTSYAETRQLEGGHYPVSNDGVTPDGVEVTAPMPYADMTIGGETYFTDTGGNVLACLDGDSTTTLNGRYVTMVDVCGAISETDAGPIHNLGTSVGTDCAIPAGASVGNTHSSRSGYYEINRIIEMAQSHLPNNSWIRNPLISTMNIDDTCNANWNGGGVNFFKSGGGCANTGEIAGVFDHEWGHGMDANNANPGIQLPSGEGIADVFASLRLNTSCIGRNFRPTVCTGNGDACTECTGVRDIDWGKHVSGAPHDVTWVDAVCGGSVHCRGQVIGESIWDLWNRDLTSAPYNMDLNTAREVATQLTFHGSGPVGTWYVSDGSGNGDGCNADSGYLNYLAADDDDGDLSNGTPHMTTIFNSFDRHGIACPTPALTDNGCSGTPTTAPTVTIVSSDRTNILSWDAIAGAAGYKVYRTEGVQGCDFGKTLIAETSNLSHLDTGLSNGREYFYTVIPMGNGASCFGPSSSCSIDAIPVAQANFGFDANSTVLTISGGDGDDYLDNCESASVALGIANIGTGSATNVIVNTVTSPSHPSIDASIVVSNIPPNTLGVCSIATTGFTFDAQDLSFGEVLEFNVCITSDDISPLTKCGLVSFSNTQSNDEFFATKTFDFEQDESWQIIRGTFDRSSGDASSGTFANRSSSLLDNQCDEILSPNLKLSATSTLSIDTNYDIEDFSGGDWWDRANVSLVLSDGSQTVVSPDGGRLYNALATGIYSGCNSGQPGWGATESTWDSSTWGTSALNSVANQNQSLNLLVNYGTDGAAVNRGFWFDDVTLTDVTIQVPQASMCVIESYSISGTVSGLIGSMTIRNNNTDDLTISDADPQSFVFPIQIDDGSPYAVTVFTQPSSPNQTCEVTGGDMTNIGSGMVSGLNIDNILVTCTTNTYTVSGNVSGATGPVTLTNVGLDPQVVALNGSFSFATQNDTTAYVVSAAGPATQSCTVTGGTNGDGSGNINAADVLTTVICTDTFSTASNDNATVLEDATATIIDVLSNDSASVNGAAPIIDVGDPDNGVAVISNDEMSLSYMPSADYCNNGVTTDDFNYTINGGSTADVSVEVTCVNDAPSFDIDENIYINLSDVPAREGVIENIVACNVDLGPGNENTEQLIENYTVDIVDPNGIIETLFVTNAGVISATYTSSIGSATVNLTLTDNGGTMHSGVDSVTKQMTIHVYDYIFKGSFETETCQ